MTDPVRTIHDLTAAELNTAFDVVRILSRSMEARCTDEADDPARPALEFMEDLLDTLAQLYEICALFDATVPATIGGEN